MALRQPVLGFLIGFAGVIFLVHSHKIRHAIENSPVEQPPKVFSQKQTLKLKEIGEHSNDYSINPDPTSIKDVYPPETSMASDSPDLTDFEEIGDNYSTRKYTDSLEGSADSSDGNATEDNGQTSRPTDKNVKCKSCIELENAKAFAIETIKAKILKKLQLTQLPNVSGTSLPKIPHLQKIIDKYNLQSDMPYMQDQWAHGNRYYDNPEDLARTEKMFALGTALPEHLSYINSSKACFFSLDVGNNIIKRGKLWVYLRPSKIVQSTVTYLKVYKLGPPPVPGDPPMRSLARTKKILLDKAGGWHHFDLVNIIDPWAQDPFSNYGLEVEALDHENKNLVVIPPGDGPDAGYEPFLAIRVIQDYRRRHRRDSSKTCDKGSTVCCRRYLLVDFQSFDWHFVVSPKKFVSYFCSGDCPLIYKQINQQTHLLKNVNSSYEACCKPSSLGPLQMLYRKNASSFVIEYIPGMVTKTCSCL